MKKILKTYSTLLFIFVFLLTILSNTYVANAQDGTSDLKSKMVPIKTLDPKNNLKDLMPLKETLKDKQIVGMGEATHGTGDFSKMKHRMFKFLVEEMGFRAFAIEALFGDCQTINDYINGIGDEDTAIKALGLPLYQCNEIKDLINWMKEYNLKADSNNKLRFYGFDMQNYIVEANKVNAYFEKVNFSSKQAFSDTFITNKSAFTLEAINSASKLIKDIIKELESSKDNVIKKSSVSEYEIILKDLAIINDFFEYCTIYRTETTGFLSEEFRDKCMSQNIKWIVDRETRLGHGKVMLWAHNAHINNRIRELSKNTDNIDKLPYMGNYLKNMYGDKYYSIGFEFFKGKFRAYDTNTNKNTVFTIAETIPQTLGYALNKINSPMFFADFKTILQVNEINELFSKKELYINSIGYSYDDTNNISPCMRVNSDSVFDGLIFIRETTECTPYNLSTTN